MKNLRLNNLVKKNKNIYFSDKSSPSVKWLFHIILFKIWLVYKSISKRNFSKTKDELESFLKNKNLNGNIIDIGGGSGILSTYWHPKEESDRYVVVDPVFREELRTQEAYKNNKLIFLQGYGEDLPVENQSFDVAIICASIDFVDNPDLVINEATRVLKKNGNLLFIQKIINHKVTFKYGHLRDFDQDKINKLLSKNFKVLSKILSSDKEVVYIWAANRSGA